MKIKTGMAFILSISVLLGNPTAAFCATSINAPVRTNAPVSVKEPVSVIAAVPEKSENQQTILAEIIREEGSETKVINGPVLILDEEGCIYGPSDKTVPTEIIKDIKITADNAALEDIIINGSLYIYADNVVLSRLVIKGTLYISPGKSLKLEQVTSEDIEVIVPEEPGPEQPQEEQLQEGLAAPDTLPAEDVPTIPVTPPTEDGQAVPVTLPVEDIPGASVTHSANSGQAVPVTNTAAKTYAFSAQVPSATFPEAEIDTPIVLDVLSEQQMPVETIQYQSVPSTQSTQGQQTAPDPQEASAAHGHQGVSAKSDPQAASIKSKAVRVNLRTASINDANSLIVIVNKVRSLPASWKPDDLVKLQVPYNGRAEARYLRKEASDALTKMFEAAKSEGFELWAVSGFRSYSLQNTVFNKYANMYGVLSAQNVSARPGQSEHQTGLAIDISTRAMNYNLYESFGKSREGKWLAENAARFGFVLRYPKGSEDITGYKYEPWHFRYVGKDIAADVTEKGITLEEYFDLSEDEIS